MCIVRQRFYSRCGHLVKGPIETCYEMEMIHEAAIPRFHIRLKPYLNPLGDHCADCLTNLPQKPIFTCQSGRYAYYGPIFGRDVYSNLELIRPGYYVDRQSNQEHEITPIERNDHQQAAELQGFNTSFNWGRPDWARYSVGAGNREVNQGLSSTGLPPAGMYPSSAQNVEHPRPNLADTIPPGQYEFPIPMLRMIGIPGSNHESAQTERDIRSAEAARDAQQQNARHDSGSQSSFDYGISSFGSSESPSEWGGRGDDEEGDTQQPQQAATQPTSAAVAQAPAQTQSQSQQMPTEVDRTHLRRRAKKKRDYSGMNETGFD